MSEFVKEYNITELTFDLKRAKYDYISYPGVNGPSNAYVTTKQDYIYNVKLSEWALDEIITVTKNYRIDQEIRRRFPAVEKAYEQYEMLLNLSKYEYEEYTKNQK